MRTRVLLGSLLFFFTVAAPVVAQETARMQDEMGSMRMIMPTDDAKVFRNIRPVVAALQVKLAEMGLFGGRINGLYGPSTRDAVAQYQTRSPHEPTGLPTLKMGLSLLGLDADALVARYDDRIDTRSEAPMGQMDHSQMAMPRIDSSGMVMPEMGHAGMRMAGMDQAGAQSAPGQVTGDPAEIKPVMMMNMPGMVMENRHTRGVAAVRDLVAALQIKLTDLGHYSGMIDGLADIGQALEAFQVQSSLDQTGELDFATALALFDLDPVDVTRTYGDRLGIGASPVALDHRLMQTSMDRLRTLLGSESTGGRQASPSVPRDTLRIEVTLKEFSLSPDSLLIPAGRPVVLVIKNDGLIPHEFMAGREPGGATFAHDLFEGVDVTMSDEDSGEAGEHQHAEAAAQEEAGHAQHVEAAGYEAAGHGDEGHGTMITADTGKTVYMSFTLPESKRGEWSTGCFLPGHYEAGMHGTLIVY